MSEQDQKWQTFATALKTVLGGALLAIGCFTFFRGVPIFFRRNPIATGLDVEAIRIAPVLVATVFSLIGFGFSAAGYFLLRSAVRAQRK
jgi:hypothetical protein